MRDGYGFWEPSRARCEVETEDVVPLVGRTPKRPFRALAFPPFQESANARSLNIQTAAELGLESVGDNRQGRDVRVITRNKDGGEVAQESGALFVVVGELREDAWDGVCKDARPENRNLLLVRVRLTTVNEDSPQSIHRLT